MAKLDGAWTFIIKTYMGDFRFRADFTVNGNELLGTNTDVGSGNISKVKKGKVDGDDFSYKFTVDTPIGKINNEMAGSVNADSTEISGTSTNEMGDFEFIGSRI